MTLTTQQTRGRARGPLLDGTGVAFMLCVAAATSELVPERVSVWYDPIPPTRHAIRQSTLRARHGHVVTRLRGRGVVPPRTAFKGGQLEQSPSTPSSPRALRAPGDAPRHHRVDEIFAVRRRLLRQGCAPYIREAVSRVAPEAPALFPPQLADFVRQTLQWLPSERLRAALTMLHPFVYLSALDVKVAVAKGKKRARLHRPRLPR